jgi:hypothetical protein
VGLEIGLLVNEPQFFPDVIAMKAYGTCGYAHESGDLLGVLSLTDEIGYLHLPGSKAKVFRG